MDKIIAQSLQKLGVRHFFTTRHGGISSKAYDSNNLGLHVGDNKESVLANREAVLKEIDANYLVSMNQIHSNRVEVIEKEFENILDCDAIITRKKDIALMVMVADCTPVLLYDKIHEVIAAVHVGRAGAFSNIIQNTLHTMKRDFNSKAENLHVVLGVSICSNCYEVNRSISDEAKELGYAYAITEKNSTYYLDVNAIIYQQLLTCKIDKSHIERLKHCSSCENSRFFSYRADKKVTGRMGAIIKL